jgi:protein TonB
MGSYRATERQDRGKALAGVLVVHVALGAAILTGLDVDTVTRAVERLKTFDITEEAPPPPIEEPPPVMDESGAPEDEAAPANIRSRPTPVVAPPPRMPPPVPLPLNTSNVRGPEGADRTAGAASTPGTGTGAGGAGTGFGGGGSGGTGTGPGSGAGFTPAQRIRKIPDSQYRRIVAATGMRRGRVGITLKVNVDGTASNCRVARSSGHAVADRLMCELAVQYMRWRPARDPQGRPVAQDVTWYPDWSPR